MTGVRMQPPRDGCYECGAPVRTPKDHPRIWVCAKCFREWKRGGGR